ncbi:MAG: hypothetical protein RL518_2537 [Pseudomonadota bacterium]|jgi:hypothetical protein
MLDRGRSRSAQTAAPASSLVSGLNEKFDLVHPSEFRNRYDHIQSSGYVAPLTHRTTTGEAITLFHDSPLLTHSLLDNARYYFPEGINGFRDQIVIDLGAGAAADGYLIARDLGARAYIGVDFCFAPTLLTSIESLSHFERTIPYSVIYDSIEEILPALPPRSCSFICAGIDDSFPGFEELPKRMGIHLPKTLHRDGACLLFSYNLESFCFPELKDVSRIPSVSTWIHPSINPK